MEKEKVSPPKMKSQLRVVTQDFSDFRPVPRQPPVFRPGDDFDNWEFHVSLYLSSIPEKHVGPYVLSFLSEEATRLFRATGIPPTAPASEIWESLRGLFRKQEAAVLYRQKFAARTQQSGETVEAFARALQELSLRAFPDLSNAERDKWLAERFCTGLHDRSLRHQLAGMLPCSFTDAMNKAQFHESLDSMDDRDEYGQATLCSALRNVSISDSRASNFNSTPSRRDCWYCRRFGNRAQFCGHNPPIKPRRSQGKSRLHPSGFLASTFVRNAPFRPLTTVGCLNGFNIQFLLDTGASCSLLRLEIADRLGGHRATTQRKPRVLTANGAELSVEFAVLAQVQLEHVTAVHEFLVCRNLSWDAILGMDFLAKHGSLLQLGTANLLPKSTPVNTQLCHSRGVCTVLEATSKPSQFETDVIEPLRNHSGISPDSKASLLSMLRNYEDLFCDTQLGRTNVIQHEIDTGSQHPIRQRARRVPIHYEAQLDRMIQEMLDMRVIRPSTSPWSSPIVLVKKKDGSLRLCVDYRKLNEVTRKDPFPLPRIDATFDALHGARWFTTLDLAAGYWQVEVRPSDREKTAFIVPSGLYEFETMPFGLANAPATFQRLMQKVLEGLVPKECLIYLDDVIVHGRSVEEHNTRLRTVLERLRQAGLKLKGRKCRFLREQVNFLGHVITPDGIQTDPDKCERIRSWPQPRSVDELRSFLGLASYYRRFVRNFASISAPLHRLTEKGRKFVWTDECASAFGRLKECLTSPPLLGLPDTSERAGPFVLDTDASNEAIGAVLSQKTSVGETVIFYASRRLDKRERKYSTTRREMLALVYFLKYFRPYLLGKPFLVRTDHQSLQWLQNFRDPEGQVARWQERLQEYDFTCAYRPGARHANADALSRIPALDEINAVLHHSETDTTWSEDQAQDPYISNIYMRQVEGSSKPSGTEMQSRSKDERSLWDHWSRLRIIGGTLFLMDDLGPKVITPMSRVPGVLQAVHQQLGHAGQLKTETAIRQRYWWPGIHADVVKLCNACEICAAIKSKTPLSRAPLEPIVATSPGQRVGVDLMGPLPVTRNGNRHLLVLIDYFTKWCEAIPIKNPDAATVASAIVNEWIARYGAPLSLHSDQGAVFESHLLQEVCRLLSVRKTRTTSYHPQGNGLVERTNRTIKGILQSFLERHQSDRWDEAIPQCMMAYRASVHATTGYSPVFLTFGHELRLPLELISPIPPIEACSLLDYVRQLGERLRSAFLCAGEHARIAQHRQKVCYDRHSRGPEYHIGDRVWLHRPRPPPGAAAKFHRQWQGPYEIVFVRSPTVYVVRDVAQPNSDVLTVHYNQLKPAGSSASTPKEEVVPPGCLPIVEHTVEILPEGGSASIQGTETLRTVSSPEGGVV